MVRSRKTGLNSKRKGSNPLSFMALIKMPIGEVMHWRITDNRDEIVWVSGDLSMSEAKEWWYEQYNPHHIETGTARQWIVHIVLTCPPEGAEIELLSE